METKTEIKKACFDDLDFFMGQNYAPFRDAVVSALTPIKKNEYAEKLKAFLLELSGGNKAFLFSSAEEAYFWTLKSVKSGVDNSIVKNRNEIIVLSQDIYDFIVPDIAAGAETVKRVQVDHVGNFISALSDKTCAVIVELFSAAGEEIYKKDFLKQISEICAVRNIAFIIDERKSFPMFTGELFAFTSYGIRPDAVIIGGNIYRAFSFGAVITGKKFKASQYKKEVGCAVCAGAFSLFTGAFNLKDAVVGRGTRLYDLLTICKKVKTCRLCGLKGYADVADGKKVAAELKEKGLKVGATDNRIIFNVPIGISEEEFEFGLNIIKDVLKGALNPFDTDKTE